MDNILPFILETLSQKPLSKETEKNILKELRQKFKEENLKISNLKKEFDEAVQIGEDLGIFRLVGENLSLPFSLENKKKQPESKPSRSKSATGTIAKKNKMATTDKEHRSSRRRRSSGRRTLGRNRSRSRSRSGARSRSQRRRRSSRR